MGTRKTRLEHDLEFLHVYDGSLALGNVVLDVSHVVSQRVDLLSQLGQVQHLLNEQTSFSQSATIGEDVPGPVSQYTDSSLNIRCNF